MRPLTLLTSCFSLVLVLTSCSEDPEPAVLPEHGDISAGLNGVEWNGSTLSSLEGDTLAVVGAGNDKFVYFRVKFIGTGTYQLVRKQAIYHGITMGDIANDFHEIRAGETGELVISEYSTDARTFKGTFQMSLTAVDGAGEIVFTEGKIDGIIVD